MSYLLVQHHQLLAGLALLAATAACLDLATVPYNAMLRQLSTPLTSGRISGFGAAAGYFGSVLLLLVVYFERNVRKAAVSVTFASTMTVKAESAAPVPKVKLALSGVVAY